MKTHPGRKSTRLKNYDYRSYGAYFVTACVRDRRQLFGQVDSSSIEMSQIGQVVQDSWLDLPNHHGYASLDTYVVMPNHFHGVVWISIDAIQHATLKPGTTPVAGFLKDSLSSIMASFKSAVTREINKLAKTSGSSFWQRSFFDHVIRDDDELQVIRQYIIDNPRQWELDRENPHRTGINPFYSWLDKKKLKRPSGR